MVLGQDDSQPFRIMFILGSEITDQGRNCALRNQIGHHKTLLRLFASFYLQTKAYTEQ